MVGEQIGLPSELLQDYAAHYHQLDPGRKFFETAKVDHWYIEATWQLNISVATGRTQLRSIFAKLGVRRQSELHRLLGRMPFLEPDDKPAQAAIVKPVR